MTKISKNMSLLFDSETKLFAITLFHGKKDSEISHITDLNALMKTFQAVLKVVAKDTEINEIKEQANDIVDVVKVFKNTCKKYDYQVIEVDEDF